MTRAKNIPENPPRNDSKEISCEFWNGKVKAPDINPFEMLWGHLIWAVHAKHPSNIRQLKEFCGINFLQTDIKDWQTVTGNI